MTVHDALVLDFLSSLPHVVGIPLWTRKNPKKRISRENRCPQYRVRNFSPPIGVGSSEYVGICLGSVRLFFVWLKTA